MRVIALYSHATIVKLGCVNTIVKKRIFQVFTIAVCVSNGLAVGIAQKKEIYQNVRNVIGQFAKSAQARVVYVTGKLYTCKYKSEIIKFF